MATALDSETIHPVARNVRTGCICPGGGQPDSAGVRFIDPCCRVHYAERAIRTHAPDPGDRTARSGKADWRLKERKRICYPKLAVAKT